jgi:hypothetical protein
VARDRFPLLRRGPRLKPSRPFVVDDPEAVTTFCAEHSIFRKMFYAIRQRAREDGPAAALELRPAPSPETITDVAVDNHQPLTRTITIGGRRPQGSRRAVDHEPAAHPDGGTTQVAQLPDDCTFPPPTTRRLHPAGYGRRHPTQHSLRTTGYCPGEVAVAHGQFLLRSVR